MNWPALSAYLEQRGLADTDGVRRKARYTRCPDCGRPVLVGLDADVAGLPRTCDTVDLDRMAEALVLAQGRATLHVLELGDRLQLSRRGLEALTAPAQERPVVATHDCARPSPPSAAWRWRIPLTPAVSGSCPPF